MKRKLGIVLVMVIWVAAMVYFVTPPGSARSFQPRPTSARERLLAAVSRGDVRAARAEVAAGADPAEAMRLDRYMSPDMVRALSPWVPDR